jgi:hypothetical protein
MRCGVCLSETVVAPECVFIQTPFGKVWRLIQERGLFKTQLIPHAGEAKPFRKPSYP